MEYLSFLEIIKLGKEYNTLALKKYDKKYDWIYACKKRTYKSCKIST
jgi:hypothetical protein